MRRHFLQGAAAATALLATGCSPLGLVNALVPRRSFVLRAGIAYAPHARGRLDVYEPVAQDREGNRPGEHADGRPLVVFFYGGNWAAGKREDYLFAGEALASRGCVAVVPDYRLYPEVRYPDFLDDCAQAVRWAADHARELGADAHRIFLMGHSAGAYNAAMLALDRRYLDRAGVPRERIAGFIGLAGPYDFLPIQDPTTRLVFGYPDTPRSSQPIEYAGPASPPALLATGEHDRVVDPANSARLATRLRESGVEARLVVYPHASHATLVGALASPLRAIAPVLDDVDAFVQAHAAASATVRRTSSAATARSAARR